MNHKRIRPKALRASFGSAIDIFGSGEIRGIDYVDTTMSVPGPLVLHGCPLCGIGCRASCPVLRAYEAAAR